DHARADAARAELAEIGAVADAFLERLDILMDAGRGPRIPVGTTVVDSTAAAELTDLVAEEIWSVELEDSLLNRRFPVPPGSEAPRPGVDNHRYSGDLMTSAATTSDTLVFINQGHTILGIDRFTGRTRWKHVDRGRLGSDRQTDQTLDLNFVSVEGDDLVTITGHASPDGRSADGKVVCLDAQRGEPRWSRRLDRIGGVLDHEGLYPHGRPLIAEGCVYVLARKLTRQQLSSCYVIALDLEKGDLRWARHIASSGGLRHSTRPLSTPIFDAGNIYIATPVGAIARLRADTGEIRWLRRYTVPISPSQGDNRRRPWELPGPVVTTDRVIAMQPDNRYVVALDLETGQQVSRHEADTLRWNAPRYLLANEHSLYAIGSEIRAFRLDDLSSPAWSLPGPPRQAADKTAIDVEDVQVRGRIQLVEDRLIVPTIDGVLVVEDQTGHVAHRLPIESPGNPLALDAQLLMAGGERLDAFMSFSRAQQMLRQRIVSSPADPEPALSLMRLGARARRLDLALEAAELALAAVGHPGAVDVDAARAELFDLLLQIDAVRIAQTLNEGESLHAMIGRVAETPPQRVEHLLAYGLWQSDHDVTAAVDTYQTILSDNELAAIPRQETDGLRRTAGGWTVRRLGQLIARTGMTAYAAPAAEANARLEPLLATPDNIAPLLALAREFPLSDAAVTASLAVADARWKAGQTRAALGGLMEAARDRPDNRDIDRLLGRYVHYCQEAGWWAEGIAALDKVIESIGPSPLPTPNGPIASEPWRSGLAQAAGGPGLPEVGPIPGMAQVIPGRLVVDTPGVLDRSTRPSILLIDELTLRRVDANDVRDEVWSRRVADSHPSRLLEDDQRLLLWMGTNEERPRAVLLDPTTGEERWTTPALARHIGDPLRNLTMDQGFLGQMPNGQQFNAREILPLVDSKRLYLVRRSGDLAAFEIGGAQVPAWRANHVLERIHLAAVTPYGLLICGTRQSSSRPAEEGGDVPALALLDIETGEVQFRLTPRTYDGVRWMALGGLGTVLLASHEGLQLVDLLNGATIWVNRAFDLRDSIGGKAVGHRVVLLDRTNQLRTIDLETGRPGNRFDLPRGGVNSDAVSLDILGTDIFARYRQRLVRYNARGTVRGADPITGERSYDWLAPVDGGLVIVSHQQRSPERGQRNRRRRYLHTYVIYHLSKDCRLIGEHTLPKVPQPLQEVRAADGWVMVSTQADTLAVPMR
ncbi:MAG: outer membrane protein assembly factor BamB family protein, partial [Planctomycetota bacterium]